MPTSVRRRRIQPPVRRRRVQEFTQNAPAGPVAPSSPLPSVQYLVAFQNNATDDPAAITAVAPPGALGTVNMWTDITALVTKCSYRRGKQHELDRFEAGECTLSLTNNDGRFNPWNTSSPYSGFLLPMKPFQVRENVGGLWSKRFTGHVSAWPLQWPDPLSAWAEIQGYDAFRLLNLTNIISAAAYSATVLADSPTRYWRLNDGVGTATAVDSSVAAHGYPVTGTVSFGAPPLLLTDTTASSASFSNNGYLASIGGSGDIGFSTVTGAFSLECWFSTTTLPPGLAAGPLSDSPVLFGWGAVAAGQPYIALAITAAGKLDLRVSDGVGTNDITGGSAVNDGRIHHVVVTRASDGKTYTLYIDGTSVFSGATTFVATPAIRTAIGGFYNNTTSAYVSQYTGTLEELAAYIGTALTSARVTAHFNAGSAKLTQQASGAYASAVLDVVSWASGARNVDTGQFTVQAPTGTLVNTKALAHLQLLETTESGALYMDGAGEVRFISHTTLATGVYAASQATFGDNAGEIPFTPGPELVLDDQDIWNDVSVGRAGGVTQRVSDATSIAAYGRRTQSLSGLLYTADADSLTRANYILTRYKQPVTRLRTLHVDGIDLLSSTSQMSAVMALDLMYRVTVNRHGPPGGGTAFQQVALIEAIEETIDHSAGTWEFTFALAPADAVADH